MRQSAGKLIRFSAYLAIAAALIMIGWQVRFSHPDPVKAGVLAADFTVMDLNGKQVNLSDYIGQGVLLQFWGSWCEPCVKEMPLLSQAYKNRPDGVEILAVNVGQSRGTVNKFANEHGLTFPVLLDPGGEASERYKVSALPATYLIDAKQRIIGMVTGQIADEQQAAKLLEQIQPADN